MILKQPSPSAVDHGQELIMDSVHPPLDSEEESRPRPALADPLTTSSARRRPKIPTVALMVAVSVVWLTALVLLVVYALSWGSAPMEPVSIR
ncbi:MAG: hypothetical protein L0G99_13725 [Propionibacteriales bacterium]|nr:hypothetical protein [Propionibacteriales bacterium]